MLPPGSSIPHLSTEECIARTATVPPRSTAHRVARTHTVPFRSTAHRVSRTPAQYRAPRRRIGLGGYTEFGGACRIEVP
eukprot:1990564-Rhodomonas_salina.3